jgi:hypothetical protein
MLEVGDVYYGSAVNLSNTGSPVDSGTVTVSVTAPNGSVTGPAVTQTGVGEYQYSYLVALPGPHQVHWAGAAPNAWALADVFYADSGDTLLISLDEARRGLGVPAANTVGDEDLRSFISAATPIIEDLIGPVLAKTRVETYDGGAAAIPLLHAPILSVTSVVESWGGGTVRTLTPQTPFTGGGDAFGYSADLVTGLLTRRASGVAVRFAPGERNVQVTYVSGRLLRPNHVLATRRLVRHLWQSEQTGFRPAMGQPDATVKTPAGFAVPKAVLEILADSRRVAGIG